MLQKILAAQKRNKIENKNNQKERMRQRETVMWKIEFEKLVANAKTSTLSLYICHLSVTMALTNQIDG